MIMHDASRGLSQLSYYAKGLIRQITPYAIARRRMQVLLEQAKSHPDLDEINQRVAYYNKLSNEFALSNAPRLADVDKGRSRYYLDLDEYSKGFGKDLRLEYLFGDVTHIPALPTVVKSRPIGEANENSVILKLNALRHFRWAPDPFPFREKRASAVWRGTPLTPQRQELVRRFYNHPAFDIGHSRQMVDDLPPKEPLSHSAQKEHMFCLSVEGNDVATNLKWAMASNMLVMSPALRYETWFMEGQLEPDRHFVMLKDDFSDLEEKVDYYTRHPDEAEDIISNAHNWIARFTDPLKETIICTRVLEKYFRLSGQL